MTYAVQTHRAVSVQLPRSDLTNGAARRIIEPTNTTHLLDVVSSKRTVYPTTLPSSHPTSDATRFATVTAATLRGCVQAISPPLTPPPLQPFPLETPSWLEVRPRFFPLSPFSSGAVWDGRALRNRNEYV